MVPRITRTQIQVLKHVLDMEARRGAIPSLREAGLELGVSHVTVWEHLHKLERAGAIRQIHDGRTLVRIEIVDERLDMRPKPVDPGQPAPPPPPALPDMSEPPAIVLSAACPDCEHRPGVEGGLGWVYLARRQDGVHKIGYSRHDVAGRVVGAKGYTGMPHRLVHAMSSPAARQLEYHLHALLAPYRCEYREWYRLPAPVLEALCWPIHVCDVPNWRAFGPPTPGDFAEYVAGIFAAMRAPAKSA